MPAPAVNHFTPIKMCVALNMQKRDFLSQSNHTIINGGICKNSHILPTGQWYAPSAVINDALIMH